MQNIQTALILLEAVADCEIGTTQKLIHKAIDLIRTDSRLYEMNAYELELMRGGHKIEAIKNVRVRLNLGLKDAKDLVEGNYRPT